MKQRKIIVILLVTLISHLSYNVRAQKFDIYQYKNNDLQLIFFSNNVSQYIPHIVREYSNGRARHLQLWNSPTLDTLRSYRPQQALMLFTDWSDDGNGGVNVIPNNFISIGIAPMNNVYDIYPAVERYRHLFSHEMTHVFMCDKYNTRDARWRSFFGTKISLESSSPITALWSYFSTPRWYAPRWYHEGIACFIETWFDGGVGRALGTYDEMYYRSLVEKGNGIYSAVGLETEGTSADFQIGATSYLYGTRFTNYLAYKYGVDSLFRYYNRTEESKRFFGRQFKKIYGKSIIDTWDEWIDFENEHQRRNIKTISEYPLTELTPLFHKPMGSLSPPIYDKERGRLYIAANYRGKFAHISYIDLKSGKEKILRTIDGPTLYRTTYLTLDKIRNRILFSVHNSDYRGIDVIDADSGKRLQRVEYQRVSELTYDNVHDCLYSIMSNAGINHLIRYNPDLTNREVLYTFNFGQTITNLEISSNCESLLALRTLPNGNEELIKININELRKGTNPIETVMSIDNVNLQNFRFADGDSTYIGSSNYTGVQNIWSIDANTKEMELLSNVTTGLFAPTQFGKDSIIALHYQDGGLLPVKFARNIIKDANSIPLLGQMVFERNPSLDSIYVLKEEPNIKFADVYNNIQKYRPFKEFKFAGAFPEVSGYRDTSSFNNVTPVIGYRFLFKDPIGLNSLSLSLGVSPWSNNSWKEKFHASLEWAYWNWKLKASYNNTDFYDLAGPTQRSRKGYHVGISYARRHSLLSPLSWNWSVSANTYGMMNALPLFQEVASPVTEMQTLSASIGVKKLRATLGGVSAESGYSMNLSGYSYFAFVNGQYRAFPSLALEANRGFLIPIGHNNSFWIRSAVGQSFGDKNSPLGNDYFGGFRNNYITNGEVLSYREVNAMPGARIDQIPAHCYAKFTGELMFTPIRFRNAGSPGFYPTYGQFTMFCTDLMANPWGDSSFNNYVNIGAQFNIEMVLFSYMKTTWSIGYARILGANPLRKGGELMLSLKLL